MYAKLLLIQIQITWYLFSFFNHWQARNHNAAMGYIAPEVTKHDQYTIMSDVYSFGVIMLELLSGRQAFDR